MIRADTGFKPRYPAASEDTTGPIYQPILSCKTKDLITIRPF
jgi:hypothetical protein